MPYLISEDTHVSRKRFTCAACRHHVEPGETYTKQCLKDGGDFWARKTHTDCIECELAYYDEFLHRGDEIPQISEMEHDDEAWLREKFPAVADRRFGRTTNAE